MNNWTYTSGRLVARNEVGAVLCAPLIDTAWAPMADLLNVNTPFSQLLLAVATNRLDLVLCTDTKP